MMLKVHSIQSLGTLDGPGIRFVVFLQGCHLRCKCCHNPDTWDMGAGKEMTTAELAERVARYREYFGRDGGITVSGGEPLLQAEAVAQLFELCHQGGINTCLDTSGSIMNSRVKKLLSVTDRVLLDIKYTNDQEYVENVGCHMKPVLDFLQVLEDMDVPTTLRQVIIPSINDSAQNVHCLREIRDAHRNVDSVELLAFRKLCQTKYQSMNMPFPFAHIPEPTQDIMDKLTALL
ncbi:MAG: pyruvate formate lyase-activating protein [Clostridia bacterium]|nr:pyruvate formate lyase-activating protein [Clostridia bacterium]